MTNFFFAAFKPELLLLGMALVVTLVDLWVKDPARRPTYWLTQLTLLGVAALHLRAFVLGYDDVAMHGMVSTDPLSHLLGGLSALLVAGVLLLSRPYAATRDMLKGELFTLSLFMVLGVCIMVSARHLLVVYLGLELMSLSLYALVALRRDHTVSTEAAMKYFVLGALASGFLLYGLSMLYGATGSLFIPEIYNVLAHPDAALRPNGAVLVFGLVFVVAGLAFKLGAAPFHMWVPDVYQGAPTATTLLIATAPKLAALAITFRLLVEGLFALAADWQQMMIVLGVFSLVVGNFVAIAQTNLKRMLAYSTIAQMGFMLLGLASGVVGDSAKGALMAHSASLFYAVVYVFTTLGSFGMILLLARQGHEAEQLSDFAGLWQRSSWYALVMAIFMLSLAGIPLTVGFHAKLAVLQAMGATELPFYYGLMVVAVVLSLIGAFYYLRVIKTMFFDPPAERQALVAPWDIKALLSALALATVVLGLLPGKALAWCTLAVASILP
ncbi:MAG: NADH-quinone oxidoreductase subunit NuoN [Inhella sp.]|uniref:NADH-quinone oxidoreductase subunit NuoN n=1 Tax=Inhella sp. TaxID=1921806 RepID=UPI0022C13850|nr:NADH-quinone oxidoreductase subunit NuoN [Inhella sp.]MCZ8236060.1 NADH-quinone oxidoreductase subunit NuoN [Inhella sp.]